MKKSAPKTNKELLSLAKSLQDFYEMGFVSRRRMLTFSFLKGVVSGAGAFIGGTVVIALLLWILSLFDQVPLLDGIIRQLQDTLSK